MEKNWDKYFYDICIDVASRTKCYSRKIGSIIVKDNTIISTGYNGPPKYVPSCDKRMAELSNCDEKDSPKDCPRKVMGFKSGEGLQHCIAAHAERNAISNAAKVGVSIEGAYLYLNDVIPCKDCLGAIINAGIREVICTEMIGYDNNYKYILKYSGLSIRTFNFNGN